ncbi:MAG: DUF6443 domain-containing protein, partial [Mediterranea sp.]|nr:DUF6443 domain-containing protein [Mediterranea sp.]
MRTGTLILLAALSLALRPACGQGFPTPGSMTPGMGGGELSIGRDAASTVTLDYLGQDGTYEAYCLLSLDGPMAFSFDVDSLRHPGGGAGTEAPLSWSLAIAEYNGVSAPAGRTHYRKGPLLLGAPPALDVSDEVYLPAGRYLLVSSLLGKTGKTVALDEIPSGDGSASPPSPGNHPADPPGNVDDPGTELIEQLVPDGGALAADAGLDAYAASFSYRTRAAYPEEEPMPSIPPGSRRLEFTLPARAGRNAVSALTSLDGGAEGPLTVSYYDGLGRLGQSVNRGASPTGKDWAALREYDGWGRPGDEWLPAAMPADSGNFVPPTSYKAWATTAHGDARPYSSPVYEASPLDRVVRQYGPGESWRSGDRFVGTNEDVYRSARHPWCLNVYLVDGEREAMTIAVNGLRPDGTLLVTETVDEDGGTLRTFVDRSGHIVLERRTSPGVGGGFLDTYYIRNALGEIRAVLPPGLSARLDILGTAPQALLDGYAYLYKLDPMGNVAGRKRPGADWEYYVYDNGGTLVFSQDGEERARGVWSFALSDPFGRPALRGTCENELDPFAAPCIDEPHARFICEMVGAADNGGYRVGKDIEGYPLVNPVIHQVSYYDNYNFTYRFSFPDREAFGYEAVEGFAAEPSSAKGLLTGTLVARLDTGAVTYRRSAFYYDDRGRLAQRRSADLLGGVPLGAIEIPTWGDAGHAGDPGGDGAFPLPPAGIPPASIDMDVERIAYNFTGQPTLRLLTHSLAGQPTRTERYTYTYDHELRPLLTTHQLDGGEVVTLVDNEYDELGRLKANKRNGNANLRTDYAYNIRSWTKSIDSPLFSQTLYYNEQRGGSTPRYNGNISAMDWKVTRSGDGKQRGYNFAYDNLSRLTAADYREAGAASEKFSAAYSYDLHGNILSLQRHGNKGPAAYGLVDNVAFTYVGNQLVKATDTGEAANNSFSYDFMDGADIDVEYAYDANGNMTMDANRGIYSIAYNVLNLPEKITFAEPGVYNEYVYSADGTKLSVLHKKASTEVRTDYVGNMIYKNDSLDMILVDGGYIKDGRYHFYLQDHLGSNRVVADANGNIVQANHYYPYGTPFAESYSSDIQKYKYIGKEYDTDNGLNWYDVEARMMDGLRFTTMDPLAEKYYSVSPYAYCAGNPINAIDSDGKLPIFLVPLIKGAVGAIVDAAAQVTVSMANGQGFGEAMSNIDYTSVGASFVTSAVTMPGMSTAAKVT